MAEKLPVNDGNISLDFKIKKMTEGLGYHEDLRHQFWLGSFNDVHKSLLYSDYLKTKLKGTNHVKEIITDHMFACDTDENWERSLWSDMRFYLHDNMLVKVDRASMLNSLEVRIPLLDYNVVEYVARIPSGLKYKGRTSKYLLKQLAKQHIPEIITNRPKKGFGIPIAKWIKGEMKQIFEETIYGYNDSNGFFNRDYLCKLLENHLNNNIDNRKLLWTLFVFIKWSEKHL